ncbi:ASCH domain-containing protein [Limosilactobacillus sp.]|uniref:ASCH domain-containing protein n=1 Tax=Limosilactobacillus sp. TaxID=2773925 RepID=UPI0035A1BE0D
MKALSIRSDYVMEIFKGTKTIEYRTWSTKYRGNLLICGTAKKVHGGLPGYATCVVKLTNIIKYGDHDYGWQLAPFKPNGSYWIYPFHVKGQLGLFNVENQLIRRAPVIGPTAPGAQHWFQKVITPLIY